MTMRSKTEKRMNNIIILGVVISFGCIRLCCFLFLDNKYCIMKTCGSNFNVNFILLCIDMIDVHNDFLGIMKVRVNF